MFIRIWSRKMVKFCSKEHWTMLALYLYHFLFSLSLGLLYIDTLFFFILSLSLFIFLGFEENERTQKGKKLLVTRGVSHNGLVTSTFSTLIHFWIWPFILYIRYLHLLFFNYYAKFILPLFQKYCLCLICHKF